MSRAEAWRLAIARLSAAYGKWLPRAGWGVCRDDIILHGIARRLHVARQLERQYRERGI